MTSSANNKAARQRGVSLVEILIVLSIAAMVAGVAIINAPPGRSSARESADQFAARIDFAAQEAMTGGVMLGLKLSDEGYAFYRYSKGNWSELSVEHISGGRFDSDDSVSYEFVQSSKKNEPEEKPAREEASIQPDIFLFPTGETTPVSVSFSNRNETFRVTLDDAGHVEVTSDDPAR